MYPIVRRTGQSHSWYCYARCATTLAWNNMANTALIRAQFVSTLGAGVLVKRGCDSLTYNPFIQQTSLRFYANITMHLGPFHELISVPESYMTLTAKNRDEVQLWCNFFASHVMSSPNCDVVSVELQTIDFSRRYRKLNNGFCSSKV